MAWLHKGVIQFHCGCHNFTYDEAVSHYSESYNSTGDREECLARINFMHDEGKRRWANELAKEAA